MYILSKLILIFLFIYSYVRRTLYVVRRCTMYALLRGMCTCVLDVNVVYTLNVVEYNVIMVYSVYILCGLPWYTGSTLCLHYLCVCTVERSARGHLHAWTLDVACLDHALVMLDTHTHTWTARSAARVLLVCSSGSSLYRAWNCGMPRRGAWELRLEWPSHAHAPPVT